MPATRTTRKTAAKSPSRKTEDKAQYERFREFAHEMQADDDPEAFDRRFRKIVPPKTAPSDQTARSERPKKTGGMV
jgi:hypothetical protein